MALHRLFLLLTSFSIFALGLVMIFSTTSADILDHELYSGPNSNFAVEGSLDKSTHQALLKQVYYAFAGLVLAWIVIKFGYRNILKYSAPLLAFFTFLLLLALIPGIGHEVNGSRRWLHLAGLSFQPSEFVKYLIPAYFIHQFIVNGPTSEKFQLCDRPEYTFREFIKLVAVVSVPMLLILVEPNNGTTAVIGMTLLALFLLTRIPFRYWAWPLLGFILIVGTFASQMPYVSARLKVYLNPELDLKGKGHQPYQAKIAAGSGKVWGRGPGNSLQKLSYLPEAQNDYIAAIYAEEFGFVGIVGLISLYLLLSSQGFYIAYLCKERGGFYLAACATFLISFQAFLNLGVVSGILPSTGLNLPLFSQGGSSLMANITGLAILVSISMEHELNKGSS